jgi:hypothetical protein
MQVAKLWTENRQVTESTFIRCLLLEKNSEITLLPSAMVVSVEIKILNS